MGHSSTNGVWLWHGRLAGHGSEEELPWSQRQRQTVPDPSGSHRAQGEATLQSLLGKAQQLSVENRDSTIMSVISAAGRGSPIIGGHHRHLSERSWVRSMGARIRHTFWDDWDVLGRIREEAVTAPDCFSGEKKKSDQEQKIEKSQLYPSRG